MIILSTMFRLFIFLFLFSNLKFYLQIAAEYCLVPSSFLRSLFHVYIQLRELRWNYLLLKRTHKRKHGERGERIFLFSRPFGSTKSFFFGPRPKHDVPFASIYSEFSSIFPGYRNKSAYAKLLVKVRTIDIYFVKAT